MKDLEASFSVSDKTLEFDDKTGQYLINPKAFYSEFRGFLGPDQNAQQRADVLLDSMYIAGLGASIYIDMVPDAGNKLYFAILNCTATKSDFISNIEYKQTDSSEGYSDEFTNWLNAGEANNKVYQGYKAGENVYTGITKQELSARLYQHNYGVKGLDYLQETFSGLTRNQARAIEQYFIENGPGNAMNQINSISSTSSYYSDAMRWATDFINSLK